MWAQASLLLLVLNLVPLSVLSLSENFELEQRETSSAFFPSVFPFCVCHNRSPVFKVLSDQEQELVTCDKDTMLRRGSGPICCGRFLFCWTSPVKESEEYGEMSRKKWLVPTVSAVLCTGSSSFHRRYSSLTISLMPLHFPSACKHSAQGKKFHHIMKALIRAGRQRQKSDRIQTRWGRCRVYNLSQLWIIHSTIIIKTCTVRCLLTLWGDLL